MLLVPETVEAQARSLGLALRIDWTHKPLSRCLVDNVALLPASEEPSPPAEMGARTGWSLSDLPHCRRLYWPGGHVRRMLRQLEFWRKMSVET